MPLLPIRGRFSFPLFMGEPPTSAKAPKVRRSGFMWNLDSLRLFRGHFLLHRRVHHLQTFGPGGIQ